MLKQVTQNLLSLTINLVYTIPKAFHKSKVKTKAKYKYFHLGSISHLSRNEQDLQKALLTWKGSSLWKCSSFTVQSSSKGLNIKKSFYSSFPPIQNLLSILSFEIFLNTYLLVLLLVYLRRLFCLSLSLLFYPSCLYF